VTGSRISQAFARAKSQGRPAFVAFVTAGDPSPDNTVEIVLALERAGVDVVELGMPFSDPVIDGPTIQAATGRSLRAGTTLPAVFDIAHAVRKSSNIALVLYSYINPLLRMGLQEAARRASEAGFDGMLTVDLQLNDQGEGDPMGALAAYRANNLDPIFLVALTTSPERRRSIARAAQGFVYLVSLNGVTGVKSASAAAVMPVLDDLKSLTDVPIAAGVRMPTPTAS
jgi:tryptophan synthase alpha chain